jgi:hypothetical protein
MRPEMWTRFLRALLVVYLIATAVHIGWVMAHEPFSFDAWNVAQDTAGKPITVHRFFSYWKLEYTHSNPRLGQVFTYLSYKLDLFAVIATPLAYLALSLAITVLGLGRWPKRGRELALWAFVVGAMWFALPELGKMMFCRAYGANYIYTAAIQLWFLVPLRLARDGDGSRGACAAYVVAGIFAGACNEHTGPTLCLALVLYAWWTQRRTQAVPRLAWAGAAGAILGFAAIFFAPGQGERYGGLAHKAGIVGRIVQRGIGGDLDILIDVVRYGAPVLGLLVILVILARDPQALRKTFAWFAPLLAAVLLIALTMFASPKQGPRFYYVSMALLLAGFVAVADLVLTSSRRLAPFVVLAVLASGYAAFRTIPLYLTMARQSAARLAGLEAAPRGSVYAAESFTQVEESWWSLGDDFRDTNKRELVRQYFDLGGVVWRAYDPYVPLGITTARLVPHIDPPAAGDALAIGPTKGFDLASMHREIQVAIATLRQRAGDVRSVDVSVELPELSVTWPRPHLLIGRWTPERYEGYEATLTREPHSNTRTVKLPAQLRDAEVFLYLVGGELKRLGTGAEPLHYVPWKAGIYWILACRTDACFVVAGSRH